MSSNAPPDPDRDPVLVPESGPSPGSGAIAVQLSRAFAQPVEGPSHRPAFRVLAVLLVVGLTSWGARIASTGLSVSTPAIWLIVGAAAVLLWQLAGFLFGRTRVDAEGLHQTGALARSVRWETVTRARVLRVPLAPRLVVVAGFGPVKIFNAGDDELVRAFERIDAAFRIPAGS